MAWGARTGVACVDVVTKMLERRRHPKHAYRASQGLLNLSKRYGDVRLEAACTMALSVGPSKYVHIRDILLNRRDLLQANTSTVSGWAWHIDMTRRFADHRGHGEFYNDDVCCGDWPIGPLGAQLCCRRLCRRKLNRFVDLARRPGLGLRARCAIDEAATPQSGCSAGSAAG